MGQGHRRNEPPPKTVSLTQEENLWESPRSVGIDSETILPRILPKTPASTGRRITEESFKNPQTLFNYSKSITILIYFPSWFFIAIKSILGIIRCFFFYLNESFSEWRPLRGHLPWISKQPWEIPHKMATTICSELDKIKKKITKKKIITAKKSSMSINHP